MVDEHENWAGWMALSKYKKRKATVERLLQSGVEEIAKPLERNLYTTKSKRLIWEGLNPGLRVCQTCKEAKILDPATMKSDWHNGSMCMDCRNAQRAKRRARKHAAETPEETRIRKAKAAEYARAFKENGRAKKWAETSREKIKQKRAEDPEFDQAVLAKRRAASAVARAKREADPVKKALHRAKARRAWEETTEEWREERRKKRREEYGGRELRTATDLVTPMGRTAPLYREEEQELRQEGQEQEEVKDNRPDTLDMETD